MINHIDIAKRAIKCYTKIINDYADNEINERTAEDAVGVIAMLVIRELKENGQGELKLLSDMAQFIQRKEEFSDDIRKRLDEKMKELDENGHSCKY